MNLFTTSTTIGLPTTVTATTLNEDGSINKNNLYPVVITSAVSTGLVAGEYLLNQKDLKKIHEESATAYIDSMSDEELASALEQLNLLEAEIESKNSNKTI